MRRIRASVRTATDIQTFYTDFLPPINLWLAKLGNYE